MILKLQHFHFEKLKSTNDQASLLLKKYDNKQGVVVSSAEQYQGKGQRGERWESQEKENLLISVALPIDLNLKDKFLINVMTTLAVYDTVLNYVQNGLSIKWPNDILIQGKKIAGILIENNIREGLVKETTIGVGLNVNQTDFNFNFNRSPTSLKIEQENKINLNTVKSLFLKNLIQSYFLLLNKPQDLFLSYIDKLYLMDEWSDFEIEGESKRLQIIGITKEGRLVTKDDSENKHYYELKEIKFLR